MKKYLPFLILVFLIILVGFSTYKLNKKQEKAQKEDLNSLILEDDNFSFEKVRIKLPDFSFPDIYDDNKDLSRKDLLGKYSVISFFASWCTTCHAQHHILLELQKADIIDIYGIAWRDINENTQKYLEKYGNPFDKVSRDSKGLFSRITGIEAVPETLIVNKKGVVVRRYQGNLTIGVIAEIKEFLKKKVR